MTGSKRVAIVATEFAPAYSWGGPVFSLLRLAKELGADREVVVFASTRMEPRSRKKITKAMMDENFEGVANITRYDHVPLIGLSFGSVLELRKIIHESDLVYINSTYSPVVLWAVALCVSRQVNVVWAPRGAIQARLQGSRRSSFLKITFEKVLGWLLKKCSAAIHVTSDMERTELSPPFIDIKTFVFPNINFAPLSQRREIHQVQNIRFLFLSRIHEKKGIFELLENPKLPRDLKITLVGPGEPADISKLNAAISNRPNTEYLGAVYDEEKKAEILRSNDILILPSHSENFGNVVIEALNNRLPVLTTKRVPIDEIDEYDVGKRVDDVAEFISVMTSLTWKDLIRYQNGFDRRTSEPQFAPLKFLDAISDE